MARKFLPLAGLLVIILSGLVHGCWTGRWMDPPALADAAAKLDRVPMILGDWQGKPLEIDTKQLGPISGYLHRRYLNQRTGAIVVVSLAVGRPGPVSIHTPDVCYVAGGFQAVSIDKFTPPLDPLLPAAEFQTAQFGKTKTTEQKHLRVFWSWNAGGIWQVADAPRLAFARCPVLYKLHLVREMATPGEPPNDDPCVELMQLLLPELQSLFFART